MVQMVRHYVLGCSAYTLLSHRTTKSPANSFVLSSRGHLLCLPSLSKERFPGKCGNSALSLWLCLRKWHSILICSADGHFGWHGMLGIGYPDFPCSLLPMVGKLGLARLCSVGFGSFKMNVLTFLHHRCRSLLCKMQRDCVVGKVGGSVDQEGPKFKTLHCVSHSSGSRHSNNEKTNENIDLSSGWGTSAKSLWDGFMFLNAFVSF